VFWPLVAAWCAITVAVLPITFLTPRMSIGSDLTGIVVATTHLGWLAAAIAVGVLVLPARPTAWRMLVTLVATFVAMAVGSEVATKAFLALHGRMPVDSGVDFAPLLAILFGVEGDIVIVLGLGAAAVARAIPRRRQSSTGSATR
jgi:hypothetical protein